MKRTGFLFRILYGRSAEMRSYEWAVMEALIAGMSAEEARKFREQLRCLPYRQRHSDDRVFAFFPNIPGTLPLELFGNRSDNLEIAKMDLTSDKGRSVHVTVFAANGCLFSLEFDESPKTLGIVDGASVTVSVLALNHHLERADGQQ